MENCHDVMHLGRFSLSIKPAVRSLLSLVASAPEVPQDLRELCQHYASQDAVPWRVLQHACSEIRKLGSSSELTPEQQDLIQQPAHIICQAAKLVLPGPPPRQRSQQLQEHLSKLQEQVDQQRYAAMVADVTEQESKAEAAANDPFFPNTKLQLSFGLHVIVTMGTFSLLGYYAGKYILHNETWVRSWLYVVFSKMLMLVTAADQHYMPHSRNMRTCKLAALLSALGLTAGLLLETVLLVVRSNMPVPLDKKYAHLLDKRWDQPATSTRPERQLQSAKSRQIPAGKGDGRHDKQE